MLDAIVILKDKYFAQTLATVMFDRDGKSLRRYAVVVCEDWQSGWETCIKNQHRHVLFVRSGTVFEDLESFDRSIDGAVLRAHIIWRDQDVYPLLHDQCWYADLSYFQDYKWNDTGRYHWVSRSTDNVHDDYTPTHLLPATGTIAVDPEFGRALISHCSSKGHEILNWSGSSRAIKTYFYTSQEHFEWQLKQTPFFERMTEHLWITNNEQLEPVNADKFIGPASGACWFLNLCRPEVKSATLVDISRRQLEFARWLLDTWDGKDFGRFVTTFLFRLKIMSFTLDSDDVDARALLIKGKLAEHVNQWLTDQLPRFGIEDLESAWLESRRKPVSLLEQDIIPWVLERDDIAGLWTSNVEEFKYSLMTNDWETIERFNQKCQQAKSQ